MEHHNEQQHNNDHSHHIVSYKEHFSTLIALLLLTLLTVSVSVFGADLRSLSVSTALLIATIKALVVAYYFMHLKYDLKLYRWLVLIVVLLFVAFLVITSIEYLNR
jgi:cytochrome c oxidase subunit 4